MDQIQVARCSYLFTMRIWSEELGDGRAEWRGQVQHPLSGETCYFRDWPALVDYLLALLPRASSEAQS